LGKANELAAGVFSHLGIGFVYLANRLGVHFPARCGKQNWYCPHEERRVGVEYCKSPRGVPPPPEGFYTAECLERLKANSRAFENWGGGDGYVEQGYRVAGVLDLPFLIAPPIFLLLLGVFVAWVFAGFSKIKNQ
jgi:hypothetical protein